MTVYECVSDGTEYRHAFAVAGIAARVYTRTYGDGRTKAFARISGVDMQFLLDDDEHVIAERWEAMGDACAPFVQGIWRREDRRMLVLEVQTRGVVYNTNWIDNDDLYRAMVDRCGFQVSPFDEALLWTVVGAITANPPPPTEELQIN